MRRACGAGCTASCSSGWPRRMGLTGAGPLSTAPRSRQKEAHVAGEQDRPEPHGPRPLGNQGSPPRRRAGDAARLRAERREPPRQPDAGRGPRCRARGAARLGPPSMPVQEAPCGQGLRPPPMPDRMPRAVDRAPHRAPRRRTLGPPRPPSLGGRAHPGLAGPLPASHHPLRAARRHPLGLHLARLLSRLPQPDQAVLLKALSGPAPGSAPAPIEPSGCYSFRANSHLVNPPVVPDDLLDVAAR